MIYFREKIKTSIYLSDNFLVDRLFDMFRNKDNGEENQITRYLTFDTEQKKGPTENALL